MLVIQLLVSAQIREWKEQRKTRRKMTMIIDYIGQELIWNLLGIHPYHKNNPHYSIKINCKTPFQNEEATKFILTHIHYSKIQEIVNETIQGINLIKRIDIKNAFGNISSVEFINERIGVE